MWLVNVCARSILSSLHENAFSVHLHIDAEADGYVAGCGMKGGGAKTPGTPPAHKIRNRKGHTFQATASKTTDFRRSLVPFFCVCVHIFPLVFCNFRQECTMAAAERYGHRAQPGLNVLSQAV